MWQNADLLVVLVILDHGAPLQIRFFVQSLELFFLRDMIDLSHYK